MKINDFLGLVAHRGKLDCGDIQESDVWLSNFDNSYMTHVGLEKSLKFLANREITEELTHGVGFSSKDNKWYGWNHRAIYGFGIGSTCKKGDCHYRTANEQDETEAAIKFGKGEWVAKTMADAKRMAQDFSKGMS